MKPTAQILLLLATIMLICAVLGCAPKAIPIEPIAPKAAHLQASLASTVTTATRVTLAITGISAKTESISSKMARAMLAADALRKTGIATQADLEANAAAWHEVRADDRGGQVCVNRLARTVGSRQPSQRGIRGTRPHQMHVTQMT